MNDEGIAKGFVSEHAAYWSDKEIIGYAMDEAFVYELDVEDLREMVFDLAMRLDEINLRDDEFGEELSEPAYDEDEEDS